LPHQGVTNAREAATLGWGGDKHVFIRRLPKAKLLLTASAVLLAAFNMFVTSRHLAGATKTAIGSESTIG
jgi:hypothetical protein